MATLTRYTKKFAHYLRNTRAVSALEYAILIGIVATALTTALVAFSNTITGALTSLGKEVTEATGEVDD